MLPAAHINSRLPGMFPSLRRPCFEEKRTSMEPALMRLKILLPSHIFAVKKGVTRLVAETPSGSFGIPPRRLDCVAALVPGILTYETKEEGEVYVAIDQGLLIKAGLDVLVSVRDAVNGTDLAKLREDVEKTFMALDEREKSIQSILEKMQNGLIHSFVEFHHN